MFSVLCLSLTQRQRRREFCWSILSLSLSLVRYFGFGILLPVELSVWKFDLDWPSHRSTIYKPRNSHSTQHTVTQSLVTCYMFTLLLFNLQCSKDSPATFFIYTLFYDFSFSFLLLVFFIRPFYSVLGFFLFFFFLFFFLSEGWALQGALLLFHSPQFFSLFLISWFFEFSDTLNSQLLGFCVYLLHILEENFPRGKQEQEQPQPTLTLTSPSIVFVFSFW